MNELYQKIEKYITQGNSIALEKILRENSTLNLNDGELYNLNPPLYRAAKLGLYDICKILIDYAINPHSIDIKNAEIDKNSESPFESSVAKSLVSRGYHLVQQWRCISIRYCRSFWQ